MKKAVFIVDANRQYDQLFLQAGWEIVSDLPSASLVCFTGGEDVSPSLYGESKHPKTYNNPQRDVRETELFEKAKALGIPMVGICRGGQFLNVMSGGKMYQHVTNHTGDHQMIVVETGEALKVSSTHHQMMRPSTEGVLLGIAKNFGAKEFVQDSKVVKQIKPEHDAEVVLYQSTKCLCFQPHPEFTSPEYSDMRNIFFYFVLKYLFNKV